ncbi:MAG: hypothetical protein IJ689_06885 [Alphaproteobacteria bacterium]|nr:hypothetical protein [Alphaproteobacteria bacterium]
MDFWQKHNLEEVKGKHFIIDMMYATPENLMMTPVYEEVGFGKKAYVHKDLMKCLHKLENKLEDLQLKLRIRDAYRPPVAHRRILEIFPVPGVFASRAENSLHCYGAAIDCCLCDENSCNLAFPTEIDAYHPEYVKKALSGEPETMFEHFKRAARDFYDEKLQKEIANRELLRGLMEEAGFEGISSEWWHYQLPQAKLKYPLIEWEKEK